jgi:hypothetical protein
MGRHSTGGAAKPVRSASIAPGLSIPHAVQHAANNPEKSAILLPFMLFPFSQNILKHTDATVRHHGVVFRVD